ncbi:MAG: undecaprenyldiphospho-muramoylpentapeptide beta-N-acetylglucosaminyltransferase [Patescibacteria group bacterium]|jgi:UDP-N-acetylglucosamine--N-acetylmuramyl-(pentapeptide) pyrophosphoryl-undecaprenol N-acetylglucosamine transferase
MKTKILLTSGGTVGSVTPLLAIVDELSKKDFEFLWIGTRKGPEKAIMQKEKITFKKIASGKLRRYFSLRNLFAPLWILIGFIQSFFIILKFRPSWIMTAGGFVSVPVIWAGWLLGKKVLVHQQDVRAGLANKLMAPFAHVITVTFKKSLDDYGKKAKWTGNPARIMNYELRITNKNKFFNLKSNLPIVLILGGGTGARFINDLVADSIKELTKICQIIHITGKGKQPKIPTSVNNYNGYEFLHYQQMAEAYARANLVIARAGLSTITELSYLNKLSIIIPIPRSHQIENSRILEQKNAAIVLDQPVLEKTFFIKKIKELLDDKELQKRLSGNIKKVIKRGAAEEIAKIIKD